ncbi:hypothetical protein SAMN05216428_11275 [Nitrosospira sp. Nsp11]|uniref:hypothetical protein n=1 Tax=Nitrosospira sp. Nsp11 TaxID=1855338 RepID=UPI00090EEF28|nr:hypothetical protein [Nitrosospira sp. Nsp11]SHM05027.1 hypothetical protein SAMN05216428_11275 [Nitrosospira sp. Nsp11]
MIELGQQGRDKVTGYEGIIIGRAQYLMGCDQYSLAAPVRDGKISPSEWFDEGRIEIIGPGISAVSVSTTKPGGPNRDAPRS